MRLIIIIINLHKNLKDKNLLQNLKDKNLLQNLKDKNLLQNLKDKNLLQNLKEQNIQNSQWNSWKCKKYKFNKLYKKIF